MNVSSARAAALLALLVAPVVLPLLASSTRPAFAWSADGSFNPAADGPVTTLAIQADGKIVVGGQFTELGGQPRDYIARLNGDGTLDETFNPGADGPIVAIAVQADGKIVVGGYFTELGGQPRAFIGRLNANGTLDTAFNPGADHNVFALALQGDGKIVVGGVFNELGGQPRTYLGRLNASGTLDTAFNPAADGVIHCLAVQADGKILVGGEWLTSLGGQPRQGIGRLNANGTVDAAFNPGADGFIYSLVLQADGKILVAGEFLTTLAGQPRENLGRLNANGSIDAAFDPGADGAVYALAVQADGGILVGGTFTTLGGGPRANLGRLRASGALDPGFDPGANDSVIALVIQGDGKIILGGFFSLLGGLPREFIGRLEADGSVDVGEGLVVELGVPPTFVPGSIQDYSVAFANGTAKAVQDAVVMVALPAHAEYLDDSGGGIRWPQRQQVFWKLGDLAPGSRGLLSFRVRFLWGIPFGIRDTAVAYLGGTNLEPDEFDVQQYLDYEPIASTSEHQLTAAEVEAERAVYPEVEQLLDQAEQQGFAFGVAGRTSYGADGEMTEIVMLRFEPAFAAMYLRRVGTLAHAAIVDSSSYLVRSPRGEQRFDLKTDEWGTVVEEVAGSEGVTAQMSDPSFGDCMENCIAELVPKHVVKNVIKAVSTVSKGVDCYKAVTGRDELDMVKCAQILKKIPGVSEGIDLGRCNSDCQGNSRSHFCTADKRYCDSGGFPYGWLGIASISTCRCVTDPDSPKYGRYLACETTAICAACQKCVDSGGGPMCVDANAAPPPAGGAAAMVHALASSTSEKCTECTPAKDPNAKYGAQGDVSPGDLLTYTITFENEGSGDAFDVFVVDTLGEHLDTATLTIGDDGEYLDATRTIVWQVGQLAPKGQPGSTGEVSFTVRLKPALPTGTVVRNQAVVHFPSVPEETPTNEVINVIQPLAAVPQTVETTAGHAVAIHLQSRGAGAGASTWAIVERPLNGELTGAPPDLTYTPAAGFTGLDRLRFTVGSGGAVSRPDEVQILVRPAADDATPPRIVWTSPAHREFVAEIGTAPRFTDAIGPLYLPPVRIEFSEAMSAATLTATTILMRDAAGRAVPLGVTYDGLLNQAMVLPRERLRPGMLYTVTVTSGAEDLGGNALAPTHAFTFQAGSRLRSRLYPAGSPSP
jgi:uncharacterized delta-60 repeat protein/uncharacterized repeat protein (TIGR01451 family)